MEMTNGNLPKGIWGTVLLPVDGRGEIDFGALREEIAILCASGLDGIYSNGTAGEFHNQTEAEYEKIVTIVAEGARGAGCPFQVGVSHTNPRIARDRLRRLTPLAPSGVQFILPDWWTPSDPEIVHFADGMQDAAAGVPLILYNPPHAKRKLTIDEIANLRKRMPNLVGTKLAGGDEAWYRERRALLPDFSVFVPGHTVAFGRPRGADGAYSNVACLSPRGALLHWQLAEEDPERATELEKRIVSFMQQWIIPLISSHGLSNIALDKMMAAIGGWGPVSERLLWPYISAPTEALNEAREHYNKMLPEFAPLF